MNSYVGMAVVEKGQKQDYFSQQSIYTSRITSLHVFITELYHCSHTNQRHRLVVNSCEPRISANP